MALTPVICTDSPLFFSVIQTVRQYMPNAPVVGTPENRSGATSVRPFFLVSDFVDVVPDPGQNQKA